VEDSDSLCPSLEDRRDICSAAEASSFGQELPQGEMFDY